MFDTLTKSTKALSPWAKGAGAVAGAANIFDIFNNIDAADNQEELIQMQGNQEEIAARQQGYLRAKQARQVMSAQVAGAASRGVSTASPSFQAVNRSSYNTFLEDNRMEALNLSVMKEDTALKQSVARNKEESGILGDLTGLARTAALFFL